MEIYCRGIAKVRHAATGEIHAISPDDLDWQNASSDDRQMGPEHHYEAIVEHLSLGLLTWGLWEYPEGVENDSETDVGQHVLVENFDFGLQHEEAEGWGEDAAPSDDPHSAFKASYRETMGLLDASGSLDGDGLINRMVFSHQITALEAYLADTLINEVLHDPAAESRLLAEATDLNKEKFTLSEISTSPDLPRRKVTEFLRGVMYHNIAKVVILYSIALRIDLLPLIPDREALMKAVNLRHDCVHRNGNDKQGNRLENFTVPYVKSTAEMIRQFVDTLQGAVEGRSRSIE